MHPSRSKHEETSNISRRQIKWWTQWFVCQSSTKANSKSGLFQPFSLIHYLASFLMEAKWIFTNFPKAHHKLGSFRAARSRLGGFTFKSNKCFMNYCNSMLKCSQSEVFLNPPLRFSHNSQRSSQRGVGENSQRLRMNVFMDETSNLQRREGESFYTCPQKTSHWELGSRNQIIRFRNWNIRFCLN
jgi:hypothetical protein